MEQWITLLLGEGERKMELGERSRVLSRRRWE